MGDPWVVLGERADGYAWRVRRDGAVIGEGHEPSEEAAFSAAAGVLPREGRRAPRIGAVFTMPLQGSQEA